MVRFSRNTSHDFLEGDQTVNISVCVLYLFLFSILVWISLIYSAYVFLIYPSDFSAYPKTDLYDGILHKILPIVDFQTNLDS
jgi:hypothetical protein